MKSLIEGCKTVKDLRESKSLYHKDVYDSHKSVIIMPQLVGGDDKFPLPGIRDVYYSNLDLTINHQYNDSSMSNPLADMIKKIFNTVKTGSYLANDMLARIKDMASSMGSGTSILDALQNGAAKVANLGLVMASDRISYFLGSTVSFSISVTTRYYDESGVDISGHKLTTLEYYRIINKRVIGKLVNISDVLEGIKNDTNEDQSQSNGINTFLQLQKAPNNYSTTIGGTSSMKDDGTQGAWDLMIHGRWIYSNLKLNSLKVTFSKEVHRSTQSEVNCPLYVDLDWTFSPSKAWTVNDIYALIDAASVNYTDGVGSDGNFNDTKAKAGYKSTPKPSK